jgi:hypothetical protein
MAAERETDERDRVGGGAARVDAGRDAVESRARRPNSTEVAGARAAAKFVGRASQLSVGDIRAAVQSWHGTMRARSDPWFAAERAAAHAVLVSGRTTDQEVLLGHIADGFRRLWYRGARGEPPTTPESRIDATEASGQYVSTVAMIAVLVRDRIGAAEFALLYEPFASLIPVDELARE